MKQKSDTRENHSGPRSCIRAKLVSVWSYVMFQGPRNYKLTHLITYLLCKIVYQSTYIID